MGLVLDSGSGHCFSAEFISQNFGNWKIRNGNGNWQRWLKLIFFMNITECCSWVNHKELGRREQQLAHHFLSIVMIVHGVKDQLNTPPPCGGARQNLLNIWQLHRHNTKWKEISRLNTKIQNCSITKLIYCRQLIVSSSRLQVKKVELVILTGLNMHVFECKWQWGVTWHIGCVLTRQLGILGKIWICSGPLFCEQKELYCPNMQRLIAS